MVETRKGLSYILEVMVAILVVMAFTYGLVEYQGQDQSWSEYRGEIAAQDLANAIYTSGHTDSFVQEGNIGSLKTAVSALSDRDTEVSGSITNIPVNEINIGFHTLRDQEYTDIDVEEVQPDDRCGGEDDLEEIRDEKEDGSDILRTTDDTGEQGFEDEYGVRLYFANTGAQFDENIEYDSVWVDNSGNCLFSDDDGPHRVHEIFEWGDEESEDSHDWFAFKGIENEENLIVHNATQVNEFREMLNEDVSGMTTDTEVNTFTFDEELNDFDIVLFRESESLVEIENEGTAQLDEFLEDNPAIFLIEPNIEYNEGNNNDFIGSYLDSSGFEWMHFNEMGELGYDDGYERNELAPAEFTDDSDSDRIYTYFRGLRGQEHSLDMRPPGKIVSAEDTRTTDNPLLQTTQQQYDTDSLNRVESLEEDDTYDGEFEQKWIGEITFPDTQYDVANYLLQSGGAIASRVDQEQSGDFEGDPYLIGEEAVIDDLRYIALPTCQEDEEDCAEFVFSGNSNIELMSHRTQIERVDDAESITVTTYENKYDGDQLRLITSLIYHKSEDELSFEGDEQPSDITTSTIGNAADSSNDPHIPYRIDLRWSR